MNRCPCGYHGDPHHSCACNPLDVQRYLARVSGPLLDRIDLHLEVPAVKYRELTERDAGEPSAAIRERVDRARVVQRERFAGRPGIFANAHMAPRDIRTHCRVADDAEALLRTAITRLGPGHRRLTASAVACAPALSPFRRGCCPTTCRHRGRNPGKSPSQSMSYPVLRRIPVPYVSA